MPTEEDISQIASNYAGSGAGVLNPQLQALAAKGVLTSAKGGRIHAATGAAISPNLSGFGGGSSTPGADENYNLAGNPDIEEIEDISKKYKEAANRGIAAMGDMARIQKEQQSNKTLTAPITPNEPRNVADINERDPAIDQADYEAKMNKMMGKTAPPANPMSNPVTMKQATQPVIPKSLTPDQVIAGRVGFNTSPEQKSNVDMSVFNTDPMQDQKPVQVAQAAPMTMNDATREVAPGIKQWYNAPLPADRDKMAALAYFAAGASPGANLGDSARAYAQSMMAREGQERAAMRAQSTAAQERSQSGYLGAETAQKKIFERGPILNQLVTNPDGTISMAEIPGYDSGFGGEASQSVAGGKPFNAETYQLTPLDAKLGPVGAPTDSMESINKSAAFDKYLATDKKRIMGDVQGSKKQFEIDNQEAQALAKAASDTQNNLYQQAIAITKLPDHGPLKVGAGSQFRTTAYDYFKTALPPGTLASLGVENPDDLANTYIANKIATVAAQRLGNDAAATWKTILRAAQPGTDLPKAASNELMTAALVAQKRDKDRGAVMQEYGNRTRGYGPSGTSLMNDVNPPGLYLRDQGVLRDLLDNKNVQLPDDKNPGKTTTENPATLLMQRKISPAQFDAWVDATYGPQFKVKHLNLSQYLQ
jgi:hypothetical protein